MRGRAPTEHNGRLIKEGLRGELAIRKDILVTRAHHLCLVLELQNPLRRIPHRYQMRLKRREEGIEGYGGAPVGRDDHGRDAKRTKFGDGHD